MSPPGRKATAPARAGRGEWCRGPAGSPSARRAYRRAMRVAEVMVFNSLYMQQAYRANAGCVTRSTLATASSNASPGKPGFNL